MKLLFCFTLLLFAFGSCSGVPTCNQVSSMIKAIAEATKQTPGMIPLLVRLGFHDCVGGCNGCINFNNPDNAGLQPVVASLNQVYANGFSNVVSLADFYALGASVGVILGVHASNRQRTNGGPCTFRSCPGPCPVPCFAFKWGRVTATDCSKDTSILPSPTMTANAMFQYFQNQFGFSTNQVVALLGAHSLGGAHRQNSGYAGKWTGPQNSGFSEIYYANMINQTITWTNVNKARPNSQPKWQFDGTLSDGSDAGFMLNTDFELFYNLTLNSNAKLTCNLKPSCGLTGNCNGFCPTSSTFQKALTYSKSCTAFVNDFSSVFQEMLTKGYTNLQSTKCACY